MNTKELFQAATVSGYVRIAPSLCLSSQKSLREEQKVWSHDDPNKTLNLFSHPFWVTTDDRKTFLGVRDERDLKRFLNIDQVELFDNHSPSIKSAFSLLF